MSKKIAFDGIGQEDLAVLENPDYNNLLKVAANHSDAIILAAEDLSEDLTNHIANLKKP